MKKSWEQLVLLTNGSRSTSGLTVFRDKHALFLSGKWEENNFPGFLPHLLIFFLWKDSFCVINTLFLKKVINNWHFRAPKMTMLIIGYYDLSIIAITTKDMIILSLLSFKKKLLKGLMINSPFLRAHCNDSRLYTKVSSVSPLFN